MAPYKGWKELERRHAKRMGGVRLWRPDFGDSAPDGESEQEVWDCKYTIHSFAIATLYAKCEAKYLKYANGRGFHLAIYAKATRSLGDLVVCRAERYKVLLEKEKLLDDHVAAFISTTTRCEAPGCGAVGVHTCDAA